MLRYLRCSVAGWVLVVPSPWCVYCVAGGFGPYHLPGVPTQGHVRVQFLQDEEVLLLQLVPQGGTLDQVDVGKERHVPHASTQGGGRLASLTQTRSNPD